jgi:hypothetical protein
MEVNMSKKKVGEFSKEVFKGVKGGFKKVREELANEIKGYIHSPEIESKLSRQHHKTRLDAEETFTKNPTIETLEAFLTILSSQDKLISLLYPTVEEHGQDFITATRVANFFLTNKILDTTIIAKTWHILNYMNYVRDDDGAIIANLPIEKAMPAWNSRMRLFNPIFNSEQEQPDETVFQAIAIITAYINTTMHPATPARFEYFEQARDREKETDHRKRAVSAPVVPYKSKDAKTTTQSSDSTEEKSEEVKWVRFSNKDTPILSKRPIPRRLIPLEPEKLLPKTPSIKTSQDDSIAPYNLESSTFPVRTPTLKSKEYNIPEGTVKNILEKLRDKTGQQDPQLSK